MAVAVLRRLASGDRMPDDVGESEHAAANDASAMTATKPTLSLPIIIPSVNGDTMDYKSLQDNEWAERCG
ncbi:MAG: hypothetical protein M3373_13035 [Gemmatimonadota bacterium]|nr:hypothetical protein [Gemmatimonadota bacterium]